jgi:hypothetical protein
MLALVHVTHVSCFAPVLAAVGQTSLLRARNVRPSGHLGPLRSAMLARPGVQTLCTNGRHDKAHVKSALGKITEFAKRIFLQVVAAVFLVAPTVALAHTAASQETSPVVVAESQARSSSGLMAYVRGETSDGMQWYHPQYRGRVLQVVTVASASAIVYHFRTAYIEAKSRKA